MDFRAGFFPHLPAQTLLDRLAKFENATRGLPVTVVAALYEQDVLAAVVEDRGGNADRVTWSLRDVVGAHLPKCRYYRRLEE